MATKNDGSTRKAPAAPGTTQAGTDASRAGQQPPREGQRPSQQPMRAAQPMRVDSALESKGSSRGTTSRRSSEEIARRAYQLWQKRGAPHGSDQEDWLEAERELDIGTRQ